VATLSACELHAEMNRAVLRSYGWDDLAAREPVFLDETNEDDHTYQGRLFWPSTFRDEVLARLLALNAERAATERAAGLVPVGPSGSGGRRGRGGQKSGRLTARISCNTIFARVYASAG
jgi:hypothetical protein